MHIREVWRSQHMTPAYEPINQILDQADQPIQNASGCKCGQAASRVRFRRKAPQISAVAAAVSPCLSFASLLIFGNNLSSQENVTLPCQLWLHPPAVCHPPPPSLSFSLRLSFHQFLSLPVSDTESFFPPHSSRLIMSLFPPFAGSPLSPSPPRVRFSSTASA